MKWTEIHGKNLKFPALPDHSHYELVAGFLFVVDYYHFSLFFHTDNGFKFHTIKIIVLTLLFFFLALFSKEKYLATGR